MKLRRILTTPWERHLSREERDAFVTDNIGLVHHIVRKISRRYSCEDYQDMCSEGIVGLVEAAQKYEPSTGNTFSTYAYMRIKGAVLNYLRDRSTAIRVPRQRDSKGKGCVKPEIVSLCVSDGVNSQDAKQFDIPEEEQGFALAELSSSMKELLSEQEYKAVEMLSAGYTQATISKCLKLSTSSISRIVNSARERLRINLLNG